MRQFWLCLVLFAGIVAAVEISSEQARLRATEYVKPPEAPVIYQQPIQNFGSKFWVIKLASESPRFIAIERKNKPKYILLLIFFLVSIKNTDIKIS